MSSLRAIVAATAILLVMTVFVALAKRQGCKAGEVGRAALVTDVGESLREICIHYRRDFHDQCIETLTDLFQALPAGVTVRVVVAEMQEFTHLVDALPPGSTANLSAVVTGFPITPWAKDRFGTMRTASGTPMLAVPTFAGSMAGARGNDEHVPGILACSLAGTEVVSLPFVFEGGDLIADEKNVYIAATCLARNHPDFGENRPGLVSRMEKAFGRPVVVLGDKEEDVPGQHIGMFLTPLGEGTVAVADPDLGLAILRKCPVADQDKVDVETKEDRFQPFRNVVRILEEKGFRVVRVPMVLTRTPRVYVTYNNAVLEKRASQKRIYMPVYDVDRLDRAARGVYEAEGWTVLPVRVAKVYTYTGSLRCLVGILSRVPTGESP